MADSFADIRIIQFINMSGTLSKNLWISTAILTASARFIRIIFIHCNGISPHRIYPAVACEAMNRYYAE